MDTHTRDMYHTYGNQSFRGWTARESDGYGDPTNSGSISSRLGQEKVPKLSSEGCQIAELWRKLQSYDPAHGKTAKTPLSWLLVTITWLNVQESQELKMLLISCSVQYVRYIVAVDSSQMYKSVQ